MILDTFTLAVALFALAGIGLDIIAHWWPRKEEPKVISGFTAVECVRQSRNRESKP